MLGLALIPQTLPGTSLWNGSSEEMQDLPFVLFQLMFWGFCIKILSPIKSCTADEKLFRALSYQVLTDRARKYTKGGFSNVEAGPQEHVGAVPGQDIFSSFVPVAKDTLNDRL